MSLILSGSGQISTLVGQVCFFAMTTAPAGFIKANGAEVSRTTYADLFAAIGTTYGSGDGSTTFNLPDLRGEFPRGLDDGRGVDTGRVMGSAQDEATKSHHHNLYYSGQGGTQQGTTARPTYTLGYSYNNYAIASSDVANSGMTNNVGGTETRPRNVALLACIKY